MISFLVLLLSGSAFALGLSCEFSAPGVHENVAVSTKAGISQFEKTIGDFTYFLDLDGETIIAISLKDNVRNVSTQTIATTGAGIFAKPRQLSIESAGRYAEVNCW